MVLKLTGNRDVLLCLGRALKWFEDYESEPGDRWLHGPTLEAERAHLMACAADQGASAEELERWPAVIGRAQTIDGVECEASDKRAWRFSLPGICEWAAFKHVRAVDGRESPELARKLAGQVYGAIDAVVSEAGEGGGRVFGYVPAFNDDPDTTLTDILNVLRLAINHEARGGNLAEERAYV